MSVLKHLTDAISGRTKYWSKTHNAVVSELWDRLKNLKTPNDTIFRHFIVWAVVVIEDLMGMGEKRHTVINIDCKKIDREKFRLLYTVILSYFSFLSNVTNKSLKDDLKKALAEVTNRPELAQRIFQQLGKHYSKSTAEINMGSLGGKIWDEIVEITGFGEKMDPAQLTFFVMISGEAYNEALKDIKEELDL